MISEELSIKMPMASNETTIGDLFHFYQRCKRYGLSLQHKVIYHNNMLIVTHGKRVDDGEERRIDEVAKSDEGVPQGEGS